ncbi:hypothetical protein [Mycobacterium vicinigordonae]|nr:hypothetical protein [Mycobacterium vicinigordonae]
MAAFETDGTMLVQKAARAQLEFLVRPVGRAAAAAWLTERQH